MNVDIDKRGFAFEERQNLRVSTFHQMRMVATEYAVVQNFVFHPASVNKMDDVLIGSAIVTGG